MALAKHYEEITERWIANTSTRYEGLVNDLFDRFPPRAAHAGEVYLTRSGRRMEDIEVCEVGQKLELSLVSTPGTDEPTVEIEDEAGRHECKVGASGQLKVNFRKSGIRRVSVSSGGYLKPYTFHVVEPLRLEQLPDFAKLIHSLADNPPQWTEQSFEEFRSELARILTRAAVPELFSTGINEFHIALYHEEQRLPAFRDRLQAAYGCLRWFIPYSDVARLVCTYFLFCANEFEAAHRLSTGSGGRLERATAFFLDQKRPESVPTKTAKVGRSGLPLLMALPDVVSFQAIEALDGERIEDAIELVAVSRRHTIAAFDKERAARLAFLEARLAEHQGDLTVARARFELLLHSPWQAIAAAAARHLAKMPNG